MARMNIEKVEDFLRGVATGDADLVTGHVDPDAYIEHDPGAEDGAIGLHRRVAGQETPASAPKLVRALQDGAFVVAQHQGGTPGTAVVFEVFRFDGDLIVEHWIFSSNGGPPNQSGHTQDDGPTEPGHLEGTERSKALVREYYETVHLGGRRDEARRWFSGDLMIRHEPGVADGVNTLLQDLDVLIRDRTIDEVKLFVGQGDLVFLVAEGTHQGEPCAYVDLYRVAEDKIVEHWGFPEPFPPSSARRNNNGLV